MPPPPVRSARTGSALHPVDEVTAFDRERGGIRIDLARFFKVTGVLLVVIAAGLLSSAIHHAGEAGWIQSSQALDLSAVIVPASDSITSGLITGLLGIYPFPTTAEVIGWLAYAAPMLAFVRKLGFTVRRLPDEADVVEVAITLPAPVHA